MLKKIAILMFFVAWSACPGHTQNTSVSSFLFNNHKKIYKKSTCDRGRPFPQMIIIPFFENATQIVPNCEVYPKHQTALALMIFYHHWLERFGDEDLKVKKMLEKVMITWGLEKKIAKRSYNLKGEAHRGATVIGLTASDSTTWVFAGGGRKISDNSLMHELVHLSLRATIGHGDSDHEGPVYDGWTGEHSTMILEAKEVLRSFGI